MQTLSSVTVFLNTMKMKVMISWDVSSMGMINGSTTALHRAKHWSVVWKCQFRMQRMVREMMFTLCVCMCVCVCVCVCVAFYSEWSVLEHYQERATAVNSADYSAMFGGNLKPVIWSQCQGQCVKCFTVAWLHQKCTTVGCQVTMATFLYLSAYSFDVASRFLSNSRTPGHRPSIHCSSDCRNPLASELWGVGTSSTWPWTVPLRLSPWFRDTLRGHHFASDQEVKESVHAWCATQPKTLFSHGIQKLVHFWTKCIE